MNEQWVENYFKTKELTKYVELKLATENDYQALGFRCGLEVHQQLLTEKKLFCRCPAGIYHDFDDFEAEIIRHMRPTLSELGEYDGTALMEFKTKKEIIYRINKKSSCTYEMDDTPPFPINRDALTKALKIAHLLQMKIVGELHITRKQYLDGSIPTGFQRTTILGIEGEIFLKNKKIRLIQFSTEEDSCREGSDIGHQRIYYTDRLGMPLIETVTYPEMLTPWEAEEACQNIRFIARSTGLVRTGIGAGRQDVNVSVLGGTRVEIKGVAHIKWIPKLTHNEAFRQKSLLLIKDILNLRYPDPTQWKMSSKVLSEDEKKQCQVQICQPQVASISVHSQYNVVVVNLPHFKNILSFFTQPYRTFADEISDRLKVVACLEKPNLVYNEFVPFMNEFNYAQRTSDHLSPDLGKSKPLYELYSQINWQKIKELFQASEEDAQIIFWAREDDLNTALETIEERIRLAFIGVPNETRKSRPDGTNIFERVLPGPDRMYPDTDSKPVSLSEDYLEMTKQNLPPSLSTSYEQLRQWKIPLDTYVFLLRNHLNPLIDQIATDYELPHQMIGTLFGHFIKCLCGKKIIGSAMKENRDFFFIKVKELCGFLHKNKIDQAIIYPMLNKLFHQPSLSWEEILVQIGFKKLTQKEIYGKITHFANEFDRLPFQSALPIAKQRWIMGKLKGFALGNIKLCDLAQQVMKEVE